MASVRQNDPYYLFRQINSIRRNHGSSTTGQHARIGGSSGGTTLAQDAEDHIGSPVDPGAPAPSFDEAASPKLKGVTGSVALPPPTTSTTGSTTSSSITYIQNFTVYNAHVNTDLPGKASILLCLNILGARRILKGSMEYESQQFEPVLTSGANGRSDWTQYCYDADLVDAWTTLPDGGRQGVGSAMANSMADVYRKDSAVLNFIQDAETVLGERFASALETRMRTETGRTWEEAETTLWERGREILFAVVGGAFQILILYPQFEQFVADLGYWFFAENTGQRNDVLW